ncbi:MAG TPA: hypothetical protein VE222_10455 [Nitrospiraceae bacterium]|jgi:hypothetical protein|nr:hypothetical protein [Nitrospiraceae bacterium]
MTTLRALVGAGFLGAVIGFVVFVPLGWAFVLYTAENASVEQLKPLPGVGGASTGEIIKSRPVQRKAELVQKEVLLRAAYDEKITYQRVAKQK